MGGRIEEVKRVRGVLPQHLHLLRGVPYLILEATPVQDSPQLLLLLGLAGGQLLGPQHINTHTQNTVTVVLLQGQSLRQSSWFCFREDGMDCLPVVPCAPSEKSGSQRGLLGPQRTSCSLLLPVWEVPPGPRTNPALKKAGFPRGPFPL